MKRIINVAKNIVFWMIVILFLEIAFRFSMNYSFNVESLINIELYSILIASLISLIVNSFNKKASTALTTLVLFILAVLFSVQCVFFKIFKTYFAFSNLELADQVAGFAGQAKTKILNNITYIIVFLIPLIIYLIFRKKINLQKNTISKYVAYFTILIITLILYYLNIFIIDKSNSYKLYREINIPALNYEKFGVLNSYRIDLFRYLTGFEEKLVMEVAELDNYNETSEEEPINYDYNITELNLDKETNNQDIKNINEYIKNDTGTQQNKYTGMFEGYNLIYITAESFYAAGIREDLTPTLYKLTHSGFIIDSCYTPNVLSTIGGEFQTLTGLFPSKDILSKWRSGTNYFPYGLAKIFKELGYNTYAYHDHYYTFQDRHKYLKALGFDNYMGVYNGMEKRINSNIWPESDIEMMEATISDYIDSQAPFMAYYMTVSGHMDYNFDGGNCISLKNKDVVKDLDATQSAKAYVATLVELDRALEVLITKLEEAGKLDNTVFVMLADHYPYALTSKDINSISSYERDDVVEINHNNLIIWNNKMEDVKVDKVCMSCDVLPTVYNLFGIKYDSRLFTGRDILSNSGGLAIMENRSWVTDKGTYFSESNTFIPKEGIGEITEDYVENISNIVQNRINIAKWIIKNNYYNFLMNQ